MIIHSSKAFTAFYRPSSNNIIAIKYQYVTKRGITSSSKTTLLSTIDKYDNDEEVRAI
jgi:hypothetical protein